MKTRHTARRHRHGFTLAEVALAMAVTAGLLAILTGMMSTLTRDVRRLKPYEAWRRPAFDGKSGGGPSSSSTPTDDETDQSSDAKTPTHTLPDENLHPGSRPDESSIPPDPDDPEPTKSDDTPAAAGDTPTPPAAPPST